jgi:exodeoxyribonuclease VII small subunit
MAKFEDCIKRLEEIVNELERGDIALEKSLALFEEGMKLAGECRTELETAEGKVELLVKKASKMQAEPFEAAEKGAKS